MSGASAATAVLGGRGWIVSRASAATAVLGGRGWIVPSLLTADECDALIAAGASSHFVLKEYRAGAVDGHASGRRCLRSAFEDPALAAQIQARLARMLPPAVGDWELVGICGDFRLTRYESGHYFGAHVDASRGLCRQDGRAQKTLFTLMVYLNEGFVGGDLVFHTDPGWRLAPRVGLGVLFAQDDSDLLHSGEAVVEGSKFILRGDVAYARSVKKDEDEDENDICFWDAPDAAQIMEEDSDSDFA